MEANEISQELCKQHLKTVVFRSYILYLQKKHPEIDVANICERAGLPLSYVMSDNNWVSVEFEARFIKLAREYVDEPDFLFKVGQFGVRPEVLGRVLHFFTTQVLGLRTVYERLPFVTSLLNKVMKLHIVEARDSLIVYELQVNDSVLTEAECRLVVSRLNDFLENIRGYYSAVPTEYGLPPAKVEIHSTRNNRARIEVSYPFQLAKGWIPFALLLVGTGLASFLISVLVLKIDRLVGCFIAAFTSVAVFAIKQGRLLSETKAAAHRAAENLVDLDQNYKELYETKVDLERKLTESDAVRIVTNGLLEAESEEDLLQQACESLSKVLDYDRSLILLADEKQEFLNYGAGYGLSDDLGPKIKAFKLQINIDSSDPKKIGNVFKREGGILIPNVREHLRTLVDPVSKSVLELSRSESFIAVPLRTGSSRLGVVIVDNIHKEKRLNESDLQLIRLVGDQIAISLERERSHQSLQEAYKKEVRLASSYSKFVPLETLEFLGYKDVFDVKIGDGVERQLTILFSDIRKFTSLCEDMTPRDTLRFLNSYYGKLSPIIKKHNGVIDKFIGDCIMAIFQHSENAIAASIEIQRELIDYNIERRLGGRRIVEAGVGICSGPVIIGPLGFSDRIEITVLSDTVNIASRLDSMCRQLNARILFVGAVPEEVERNPDILMLEHADMSVKGKEKLLRVHELVDKKLTAGIRKPTDPDQEYRNFVESIENEIKGKKQLILKKSA